MATNTDQRISFDRHPPEPALTDVRDWLTAHGIDPCVVAVPGWIERRTDARQVAWEAYEWVTDEDGRRTLRMTDDGDDALRHEAVLQLEARPLPFPDSATKAIA